LPILATTLFALLFSGSAQAVHDLAFQLDGETTNTAYSPPLGASPNSDWNDIFTAVGDNTSLVNPANDPGFTHADFVRDFGLKAPAAKDCSFVSTDATKPFCTGDTSTFATGSKDTLNITPGWQCNVDNNVNSKIDIMNAYAVSYTASNDDHIIYFGMEKNKDNGVNDVGFWFLQGNANCSGSPGGGTAWTGTHTTGDVLVVSEFSNGGGVSNVTAYKWVGGNNPLVPLGQGGDCKNTTGGDNLCATTNAVSTDPNSPGFLDWNEDVTTKWLTADATLGVGKKVVPPDFFEGGINITQIFATGGGGTATPSCFNTFLGDTRSSKETGATLFDYARGQLGECSVTMSTTPSTTSTTLAATGAVTDTANIVGHSGTGGTAPSPTGTVDFFLCSPSQLTLNGTADPVNGVCESGGTAPPTGNQNPVQVTPGTAPNSSATSGNVRSLLTAAGRYCFRAVFTAAANDPNYGGQTANTSNPAAECLTVTGTSSSSSKQRWLPNDRVTLTGDGNLNGTLTVTLYSGTFGGTAANCTAPAATATAVPGQSYSITVTNGDKTGAPYNTSNTDPATAPNTTFYVGTKPNGDAGGAAGTYFWLVHYVDNALASPTDRCETSTLTITD